MTKQNIAANENREIVITRIFDATRERVWQAWTDPKQIVKWWGPNGFTNTLFEMDVRPGGVWRHMMHGPDGTDYPNKVVYIEVVKPERLVYSHGRDDDASPCQRHVTVTFEEAGKNKTTVTLRMLFESEEERNKTAEYAVEGGNQTFARMAKYVENH
jgi:uncharacterized protein YndB with AHSA1/START domain